MLKMHETKPYTDFIEHMDHIKYDALQYGLTKKTIQSHNDDTLLVEVTGLYCLMSHRQVTTVYFSQTEHVIRKTSVNSKHLDFPVLNCVIKKHQVVGSAK